MTDLELLFGASVTKSELEQIISSDPVQEAIQHVAIERRLLTFIENLKSIGIRGIRVNPITAMMIMNGAKKSSHVKWTSQHAALTTSHIGSIGGVEIHSHATIKVASFEVIHTAASLLVSTASNDE